MYARSAGKSRYPLKPLPRRSEQIRAARPAHARRGGGGCGRYPSIYARVRLPCEDEKVMQQGAVCAGPMRAGAGFLLCGFQGDAYGVFRAVFRPLNLCLQF